MSDTGEKDTEVVLYSTREGIATVTFNRPDRLNAWTPQLGAQYFAALDAAMADTDVQVVVVTGFGRGFCAGADMGLLQAVGSETADLTAGERDERHQYYPATLPKPVIAAINGPVAGIGLVIALFCDIRFAAEGAKMTTAFSQRGLIAEHGMSWVLPRLVGPENALDLLLSGRVFTAEEAKALGLVSHLSSPERLMADVMAYAGQLVERSAPSSMATMKRQVWQHLDADLESSLEESIQLMGESLKGGDFREGVASFVEKRRPNFRPIGAE